MREIVETLAGAIGERNVTRPRAYAEAAAFIEQSFPSASRQTFEHGVNIECEVRGNLEIVIEFAQFLFGFAVPQNIEIGVLGEIDRNRFEHFGI